MLTFMIKAAVQALKKFPDFNASLEGDNLVYKKYYDIGFTCLHDLSGLRRTENCVEVLFGLGTVGAFAHAAQTMQFLKNIHQFGQPSDADHAVSIAVLVSYSNKQAFAPNALRCVQDQLCSAQQACIELGGLYAFNKCRFH
jgi:hypothetical protein